MKNVAEYEQNKQGRDFFTTDIHGCFDLLTQELQKVLFNPKVDRLFVGGDCCDRGSQSGEILDWINEPWFISVRGNHEQMVVDYIDSLAEGDKYKETHAARMLYFNGGEWFFDQPWSKQMSIYESFKSLPLGIEMTSRSGKKVGIVHAQVPFSDWEGFKEMSWESAEATALWARSKYDYPERFDEIVDGVDVVLSGHTITESKEVEKIGNQWYCDVGSFVFDKLTLFEIQ